MSIITQSISSFDPHNAADPAVEKNAIIIELNEFVPSIEQVDWAAGNLDLPTAVRFHSEKELEIWKTPDGSVWRKWGEISATPEGAERFRIRLYRGATLGDLLFARKTVERASRGHIFDSRIWDQRAHQETGKPYWFTVLSRAHREEEPRNHDAVLYPCTVSECILPPEKHIRREPSDDYEEHIAVDFDNSDYAVSVTLERGLSKSDDNEQWRLVFHIDDCESLSVEAASRLASDIQWCVAEAKRLNSQL